MIRQNPKMIMVGGTYRNVGKTEYACRLIERLAKTETVYGLKIKTIRPGDAFFHGKDTGLPEGGFVLTEEYKASNTEDTHRMLLSGAQRVFKLKSRLDVLEQAYDAFMKEVPANAIIVCESVSLRYTVRPGLFILIYGNEEDRFKPSAKENRKKADYLIESKDMSFSILPEEIKLSG